VRDSADASELKKQTVYIDNTLAGQDVFGIVAIDIDQNKPSFPPTLPAGDQTYEANFVKRSNVWKYYIIDKNGKASLSTTVINDIGGGGFTFATRSSVFDLNGLDAVYIVSNQSIPFTEVPKKFQLTDGGAINPLVDKLPNPNLLNLSEEVNATSIFIYV
jgi:hypothetical protein